MLIRSSALSLNLRGNNALRHKLPLFHQTTSGRQAYAAGKVGWTTIRRRISSITDMDRYKLVYTVPASHLIETKDAIFKTGAGVYDQGKYVQVAFELTGQGQFVPVAAAGAQPHTGSANQLERVLEYRVEILCVGRDVTKAAVAALRRSHPYEVPAYEVYKLEDF